MKIETYHGDALLQYKDTKEPIIERFFYTGDVMLIKAQSGQGKSVLAQTIAFSLAGGKPLFGMLDIARPYKVAYFAGEVDTREWADRWANMAKAIETDFNNLTFFRVRDARLHTEAGYVSILNEMKQIAIHYDVLIFDPVYKLMVGGRVEDSRDATAFVNYIELLAAHYDASVIIVHHDSEKEFRDSKGGKHSAASVNTAFGSTFLMAHVTHSYTMTKYKANGIEYRKLLLGKDRDGNMLKELDLVMVCPQNDVEGRLDLVTADCVHPLSKDKVLNAIKMGINNCTDICKHTEISEATFYNCIKKLMKDGYVEWFKLNGNGKTKYYRLTRE